MGATRRKIFVSQLLDTAKLQISCPFISSLFQDCRTITVEVLKLEKHKEVWLVPISFCSVFLESWCMPWITSETSPAHSLSWTMLMSDHRTVPCTVAGENKFPLPPFVYLPHHVHQLYSIPGKPTFISWFAHTSMSILQDYEGWQLHGGKIHGWSFFWCP